MMITFVMLNKINVQKYNLLNSVLERYIFCNSPAPVRKERRILKFPIRSARNPARHSQHRTPKL